MKKTSTFQIIIIVIGLVGAFVAVMIFAGVFKVGKSSGTAAASGTVVLWGTYDSNLMYKMFDDGFNRPHQKQGLKIAYVQKNPNTLDDDLTEAIASGKGPDLIFLPQDSIVRHSNKIFHIPYTSVPERTFRDTYIQEADLYLKSDGILGFPISVDPLVFYYNRTLFQNAGIALPPKTWDDVVADVPLLTKKDANNGILQSAIALGATNNVNNSEDIIATLLLQSGNQIASPTTTGSYRGTLEASPINVQSILFYTQFGDPQKTTYTWNASLPNARDAFVAENLAMYIGYASEYPLIASKNPNLNFDVIKMPQNATSKQLLTFGNIQAIAIAKGTKNFMASFVAASELAGSDFAKRFAATLLAKGPISPVRREILTSWPESAYGETLISSALITRAWPAPTANAAKDILNGIVNNVIRGTYPVEQALAEANNKLNLLYK